MGKSSIGRLAAEWVEKAEGDFAMVLREHRARKNPNYDGLCFHALQCAEKYLKARLQEAHVPFPLTHDLAVLLRVAIPLEPEWMALLDSATLLTDFAVAYRYPGNSADKKMAREAFAHCQRVRASARKSLGLEK